MRLIHSGTAEVPPADIKAAGFDGVVVCVSGPRYAGDGGVTATARDYADTVRAAGLHVVSLFGGDKPAAAAPADLTRGFDGGVDDARTALRLHEASGGTESAPIIFGVDRDITRDMWNSWGVEWFRGVNTVLGVARTGIFGHSRVCHWAIRDGVIGESTSPGRRWAWQTKAWSLGEREPVAVLFHNVIDTVSNPGPVVGGAPVDVSDALATDFGQWDLDRSARRSTAIPHFDEHTDIRSPYRGSRRGTAVSWFVLHAEDGDSPSARDLARYLAQNASEVSYHYVVDDAGQVHAVVDTENSSNSLLEPGNSKSINLVFAGAKSGWSRQAWFDRMRHGIDVAAYLAVRDARHHGLPPRVISADEARRGDAGILDHNAVRIATGVGTHTDVGAGFDWDYFRQKVDEYAAMMPAQPPAVSEASYPGSPIGREATGRNVATIQDRLNTVAGAGLLVDGEYGPVTGRAVMEFQQRRGLGTDGEVGPGTWSELFVEPTAVRDRHEDGISTAAAGSVERRSRSGQPQTAESAPMSAASPVTGDPLWLEDVLRPALGDRLRTLPGWQNSGIGGTMGRIWGIIWHHTGNARASAQSIRAGRPDLRGPLAQLHIAPDGIVTIVAVGPCNHGGRGSWAGIGTDNANAVTIGIECAWPFDTSITEDTQTRERWPDAQIIAMRDVGAAITKHLGVGAERNISHEEWAKFGPAGFRQGKWDPGNLDMDWFRGEIAKDMRGEFDRSAGQRPTPRAPESVMADPLGIEWPQLGGQTLVNAVAEIRDTLRDNHVGNGR